MDDKHRIADEVDARRPLMLDALAEIADPAARVREAAHTIAAIERDRTAVFRARGAAVRELQERDGLTWAQVGAILGVAGPRAYQIAHGKNR